MNNTEALLVSYMVLLYIPWFYQHLDSLKLEIKFELKTK